MDLFQKINNTYESLWKLVVRPARNTYPLTDLGPQTFKSAGRTFERRSLQFSNSRGLVFYGSHYVPVGIQHYPVIIYLHGNSSNQVQGLEHRDQILRQGISLMVFDFSGCGNSEGQYISLGWFEQEDLAEVVFYLRKQPQVTNIALWGRSMGATTALMYLSKDSSIKAAVFDSAFKNLESLIVELCLKNSKVPSFILQGALKIIGKTIEKEAGFRIQDVDPLGQDVSLIDKTEGYFLAANKDELISCEHTMELFKQYKGNKRMQIVDGNHNSNRPRKVIQEIMNFLKEALRANSAEEVLNTKIHK